MSKQERESGIELLRVVCILLIIAHHYVLHGDYPEISAMTFSWQNFFLQIVGGGGSMACDVFILITGFYMIGRENISKKKTILLVFEMLFYGLFGVVALILTGSHSYSKIELIKAVFPILWGNWFCVYYIVFSMFILYLNRGLNALSKEQYKKLVVIILVIWSIIPTLTGHAWKFGDYDTFVFMYIVGGYLGKHYVADKETVKKAGISLIVCVAIYILSVMGMDFLGIKLNKSVFLEKAVYLRNISSVISVVIAISLVLIFKNLNFKSKTINNISGTVLGTYLLHDNSIIRNKIWNEWCPNNCYITSQFLPLHFVIKVCVVFVGCTVIDLIRKNTVERFLIRKIRL